MLGAVPEYKHIFKLDFDQLPLKEKSVRRELVPIFSACVLRGTDLPIVAFFLSLPSYRCKRSRSNARALTGAARNA